MMSGNVSDKEDLSFISSYIAQAVLSDMTGQYYSKDMVSDITFIILDINIHILMRDHLQQAGYHISLWI